MSLGPNQIIQTEIARFCARFDIIVEDMMRTCSHALMESDAAFARVQQRPTVKCPRCRVTVDPTKVSEPNRCMDRTCPLKEARS